MVNILSNPALLLDQENMVVDFTTMQYQHYFPSMHHIYKQKSQKESLPKKWPFVEPVPVNEPSPSKVTKYLASDHPYANTKTCPETQVSALKKRVKVLKQKV